MSVSSRSDGWGEKMLDFWTMFYSLSLRDLGNVKAVHIELDGLKYIVRTGLEGFAHQGFKAASVRVPIGSAVLVDEKANQCSAKNFLACCKLLTLLIYKNQSVENESEKSVK